MSDGDVQRATRGLPCAIPCRLEGSAAEPAPSSANQPPLPPATLDELITLAADFDAVSAGEEDRDDTGSLLTAAPANVPANAAEAITLDAHRRAIVADAFDRIAGLARQRVRRPWKHKPSREQRILEQLDAIAATRTPLAVSEWGAERAADGSAMWALFFVLGCTDSHEAFDEIVAWTERVDAAACSGAAEALAVSPCSRVGDLAAMLLRSPAPTGQAVGIELSTRRELISRDDLVRWLAAPASEARATAVRCLGLGAALGAHVTAQVAAMLEHEPRVAVEAARALALWGDWRGLDWVRRTGFEQSDVADAALELFVLSGAEHDLDTLDPILRRRVTTTGHLDLVARFGHPGCWSFLIHHLDDDRLAEAAADALCVLFGALVGEEQRWSRRAWEEAVAIGPFEDNIRYRGGIPWSPVAVVLEVERGDLTSFAVDQRTAELRARCAPNTPPAPWLGAWHPTAERQLQDFLSQYRTRHPSSWG